MDKKQKNKIYKLFLNKFSFFSLEKRKSFNKIFFIILLIIFCLYISSVYIVWKKIEIELANVKPSGIIIELKDEKDRKILSSEEIKSPIFGVIIDNYIDSRPAIGLSRALFVWEAPVEAGITRFMAIFSPDEEIEKIGPVRSLRPYFVDWAAEIGAVIVHCGGSPEALQKTENIYARHLDQFFDSSFFWRTWKRFAPHDLLTSAEKLKEAVDKKKYEVITFDSWRFKEDAEILERPKKQEMSIDFWRPEHKIEWEYSRGKNDYIRNQAGTLHKDDDGNEIRAKNIIIQFTDIKIIDSVGRREIKTIGDGRAAIFLDGKRIGAFWKKPSLRERTKFYDERGKEIIFNKGTTWIEVVPLDTKIVVTDEMTS